MKIEKTLLILLLITNNSFAQCYSKIISYSRNYIALQTDGTLWSKGTTYYRKLLGFGDIPAPAEFTQIGTDNNWTENISVNGVNVFAIKTDGTLWVWGSNYPSGAAGLGTYDDLGYFTPRQIGTDTNWTTVSAGGGFTVATKTDGTLWTCGYNNSGQLGTGNIDDNYKTNVLTQVGTENNWTKVFTGDTNRAYAIKTDGTLWSWGGEGNFIGYADANQNNNYRIPQQIGTDTWQTISVESFGPITQGIKTDGSLWSWGISNFQCYYYGNGIDAFSSQIPVRIGNDSDWQEIHVGQGTIQALKTNGTRWGWGRNTNGQELGTGTGMIGGVVTLVTQLDNNTDWKRLNIDIREAGYGDGIKESDALYHWGNNNLNVVSPTPILFSPNTCTLGVDDFNSTSIFAYPNPVQNYIHIHFNDNGSSDTQISVFNQLGQKLLSQNVEIVNQECKLNLSCYAAGIYFLTLEMNGKIFKIKVIK